MSIATSTAIRTQLRALEHLTRSEIALARTRVAQARTSAVRAELEENARKAEERSELIARALRDVGTVPDVLAPVVGWAVSLAKAAAEQAQPIDEALLGDLALEHQLADRSRYLLALSRNGPASVHQLAERLLAAHTETIEWLQTVLAETAVDGPAKLGPTPFQAVAAGVTRAAQLPVRLTVDGVNRAAHQVSQVGRGVQQQLGRTGDRFGRFASDTGDVVGTGVAAGVDAASRRAESVARAEGAARPAGAARAVRRETGSLDEAELPIRGYDDLAVPEVVSAVDDLREPTDLRAVLAYEERHKNRRGVLTAVGERIEAVAKDAADL